MTHPPTTTTTIRTLREEVTTWPDAWIPQLLNLAIPLIACNCHPLCHDCRIHLTHTRDQLHNTSLWSRRIVGADW